MVEIPEYLRRFAVMTVIIAVKKPVNTVLYPDHSYEISRYLPGYFCAKWIPAPLESNKKNLGRNKKHLVKNKKTLIERPAAWR